jgi:AcrR family transcriptional regulator
MRKSPKARTKTRPRRRLDTDERRAQLLDLAQQAFATRAYDEVSVDDLARAAGVSKGLLYHYFPTKRDLYVAGLREASRLLIERTVAASSAGSPIDRIRGGLDAYLDYAREHAHAFAALLRGGIGSDPEVAAVIEDTRAAYVERLLEGSEAAPLPMDLHETPILRLALRGWVGFVEHTSLEWIVRPGKLTQAHLRELLVEVLMATLGIAARAS